MSRQLSTREHIAHDDSRHSVWLLAAVSLLVVAGSLLLAVPATAVGADDADDSTPPKIECPANTVVGQTMVDYGPPLPSEPPVEADEEYMSDEEREHRETVARRSAWVDRQTGGDLLVAQRSPSHQGWVYTARMGVALEDDQVVTGFLSLFKDSFQGGEVSFGTASSTDVWTAVTGDENDSTRRAVTFDLSDVDGDGYNFLPELLEAREIGVSHVGRGSIRGFRVTLCVSAANQCPGGGEAIVLRDDNGSASTSEGLQVWLETVYGGDLGWNRAFNTEGDDRVFNHSLELPLTANYSSAHLSVELTSGDDADWITLGVLPDGSRWTTSMQQAGATRGEPATLTFDLGNVDADGHSLLQSMRDHGRLDIVVHDDANVHSVELTLCGRIGDCADGTQAPSVLTPGLDDIADNGSYSNAYTGVNAFNPTSTTRWISEVYKDPAILTVALAEAPATVLSYEIFFTNGRLTTRAPNTWTLEGSLDGQEWVVVDSQSGESGWAGTERRAYVVANPGSYETYRLHVTIDNDDRAPVVAVSIAELQLRAGCSGETTAPVGDGVGLFDCESVQVCDDEPQVIE